jgi:plastocyanin
MLATRSSSHSRSFVPVSLRLVSPLLIALALACGGGGDSSTNPPGGNPGTPGTPGTPSPVVTTSVNLQGSKFVPADIQVSPGATITFTNLDGIAHTVTFSSTAVTSVGSYTTGERTVTMPTTPGSYPFHCNFHGNMTGSVLVK